jgi:hypothetical protein
MVPDATFTSYYGRPIIKAPVWRETDIAGYLFAGGLAAGSSLLAAGGDLTQRPALRRSGRITAVTALAASAAALIHDLGKPERFHHMLRVAKPTSPMSVGTWLLAGFGLPASVAAVAEGMRFVPAPLRAPLRVAGRPAGLAAAVVAPAVATYTAVLICDTAVPAWHEAYPEMPFVFAGSAATAAAGVALMTISTDQSGPALRFAAVGAATELAASRRMRQRIGFVGEPYEQGRPGKLIQVSEALTTAGVALSVAGRRRRALTALGGGCLVAASALTRFGVFEAGMASAKDPAYTVGPQRERLNERRS